MYMVRCEPWHFFLFIDWQERNIDFVVPLHYTSLVAASCMCPDQEVEPTALVYQDNALTN